MMTNECDLRQPSALPVVPTRTSGGTAPEKGDAFVSFGPHGLYAPSRFEAEVERLQAENGEQAKKINQLQADIAASSVRYTHLQYIHDQQAKEIEALRSTIERLREVTNEACSLIFALMPSHRGAVSGDDPECECAYCRASRFLAARQAAEQTQEQDDG